MNLFEGLEELDDPSMRDALIETVKLRVETADRQDTVQGAVGNAGLAMSLTSNRDGVIPIYRARDGEPSFVLRYMLPSKLQQRDEDGNLVWLTRPTKQWQHGTHMCLLNPNHPRRAYLDSIGLQGKACSHSQLASEFEVQRHMKLKHKSAWQLMQEQETREQRDLQTRLLERQTALLEQQLRAGKTPEERKEWGQRMTAARAAKKAKATVS